MRFSGLLATVALVVGTLAGTAVQAQAAVGSAPAESSSADGDSVLREVTAAFEQRYDGIHVDNVRRTPLDGLYEVQVGMNLVYVDKQVDYVLQGTLIDAKARTDLTAARIQQLSEVPFDTLPLELAVKQVKGDGSRVLAIFEDPNCGYCKQLHANLKDVDNTTIYSFLLPILSEDSVTKARNIWCADNAADVWRRWMQDGDTPPEAQCDDDPSEQVLALGQRLMVQGTPAIFFSDDSRVNGAISTDELNTKLDSLN